VLSKISIYVRSISSLFAHSQMCLGSSFLTVQAHCERECPREFEVQLSDALSWTIKEPQSSFSFWENTCKRQWRKD